MPADDKKSARLIVSSVILDHVAALGLKFPKATDERRKELLALREQLVKSG